MVSLVLFSTIFLQAQSQNLLINGDFEETVPINGNLKKFAVDTFYCKYWYDPTESSVDIIRDKKACDSKHVYAQSAPLRFCTNVKSGNYCLGFAPITFLGYMEHLTGQLKKPLENGKMYKVSFFLKFSDTKIPYIPNGIGYKLSKDSMLFATCKEKGAFEKRCSPFYNDIFQYEKIYADYEIADYVIDTSWTKYESTYIAKGGEKYFTFGRFAYPNDAKIIKHLKKIGTPYEDKIYKLLRKGKSLICKDVLNKRLDKNFIKDYNKEFADYYFIDLIEITEKRE
jgi:hypothetical protein